MAGSYGNFDVLNNTGGPTRGFEMEVWGVNSSQIFRIFPSNFNASVIRYGVRGVRPRCRQELNRHTR
jgi:hypothetical protein